MRFEYIETKDKTIFKAFIENDDEKNGFRGQGPYVPIELTNNALEVYYVSKKKLHPDIVAAICLTCFYPWIKYSATMPFPVSKTFALNLGLDVLPQHEVIDGVYRATKPITITNIDYNLEPYKGGSKTVIAYGGGVDSTSVALMFPDIPLIHSINVCDVSKDKVKRFVEKNLENSIYAIESNCKLLCKPSGFTTFTNIFIIPLILSADLSISNVMCGSILGSMCLSNGIKYFPQFNEIRRNRWERFYKQIGLNIFSPISGCSELFTSKINYQCNLSDKVLYCEINKGEPCNKCTKCLRKQLQFSYHGNTSINFDTFDEKKITLFLKKRPLYFSHIFTETIKNNKNVPEYMRQAIQEYIPLKTDLFNKIYSKSFVYFPEDIKDEIIEKLKSYAEFMNDEEEKYLENWDITV
tara:strand:- start:6828 stop:8057 length:1230 start_codon:yes stop_codon:yes gene_type:complete